MSAPTVGLVIVSHSARLAEGVVELAREMAGAEVRIVAAGGLDEPGDPIGTDAVRVMGAIESVTAEGGTALVLMDLGSAVLSAETALDLLDDAVRARTLLCEAPLVEGAVAAAAAARAGATLAEVAREARAGLAGKEAHLGTATQAAPAEAETGGDWSGVEVVAGGAHGLHARPAAAVVRAVADHDAEVRLRNLTTGAGPADARSMTALATLGAREGHRLRVEARGPDASVAIAQVAAIVEERGDSPPAAREEIRAPVAGEELRGAPSSPGLGSGPALLAGGAPPQIPDRPAADAAAERVALREALAQTGRDLEALRASAAHETAEIIGTQILLLGDIALVGEAERAIDAGAPAARAWHDATGAAAASYERLHDEYLRARAADVRDVGRRVVALLVPAAAADPDALPGVLVARDLGAAEVAGLDRTRIAAIAMAGGGPTAHAAIIARSLGIPAVTGLGEALLAIPAGTLLLVDGDGGAVVVGPTSEAIARHDARVRDQGRRGARAAARAHEPATTADGRTIEVAANIGAPGDLEEAVAGGADGVGLLRTEFLFLGRADAPGEDEQYAAYADAVGRMQGRRVVLRTLDAGGDKPLGYVPMGAEQNPFLGVRGIRLSWQHPTLLMTQLRAALRAAADGPLSVMFPMVSEFREVGVARGLIDTARATLTAQGIAAGPVEVGIMIEVPAAAVMADVLAPAVDFLSIGTNDLVQYVMAAERGNAAVADLSDALHPAVLRLIAGVVEAAGAHGCRVAVCGEVASDAFAVPVLVGLGVDELSVTPRRVGLVKDAVRGVHMPDARALAHAALEMPGAQQVRRLLAAGTVGG